MRGLCIYLWSWAVKGEGFVYLWSWRAVKDEGFVYLFVELGSER